MWTCLAQDLARDVLAAQANQHGGLVLSIQKKRADSLPSLSPFPSTLP